MPDEEEIPALSDNQPLTSEEDVDFKRCETIIEENKTSFVETCAALNEIWSKRLFRIQYKSFKEYCEKKWKFSRAQGYRLLKAHETLKQVSPMGDTSNLTITERPLRELAKVSREKRAAVLKDAKEKAGSASVTNRHIRQATADANGQPEKPDEAVIDETSAAQVEEAIALTQDRAEIGLPSFQQMYQMIENIAGLVEDLEPVPGLKPEIAKLRSCLRHYSQLVVLKEAA